MVIMTTGGIRFYPKDFYTSSRFQVDNTMNTNGFVQSFIYYVDRLEEDWVVVCNISSKNKPFLSPKIADFGSYSIPKKLFPPNVKEGSWYKLEDKVYGKILGHLEQLKTYDSLQPVFVGIRPLLKKRQAILLRKKVTSSDKNDDIIL